MDSSTRRYDSATETVLILAAGVGSRLQPITNDIPKALVPVDGRSLVDWQLSALREAGYPDEAIHVVGGHRVSAFRSSETVPESRLMVFEDYETVNNIGTLAYALERVDPPVLVINSDTLFSSEHLSMFQGERERSELLYDPTTPPRQEAMKIEQERGRLLQITKEIEPADADGEYIGLVRIGTGGYKTLLDACRRIAAADPSAWYEQAIHESCDESEFRCRSIGHLPWIEIDDHEDLASAAAVASAFQSRSGGQARQ